MRVWSLVTYIVFVNSPIQKAVPIAVDVGASQLVDSLLLSLDLSVSDLLFL